jgi:putative protease
MKEVEVGKATHYFSHLSVAAIELSGSLRVGDKVHIKGHTTDFFQEVESMQIEHQSVSEAKAGDSIGLKVREKVREGDTVYKVVEE